MPMDPSAPWRAIESMGAAEPQAEEAPRRPGQALLIVAAAGIIAASLGVALAVAAQQGGAVEVADPSGYVAASPSPQLLVVEVAGAVSRPGVYELPAGSRVADAIKAAGGYSADVDPRAVEALLNLAARLQAAQLIRVPRRGEAVSPGAGGGGGATGGGGSGRAGSIDINTATAEELDTLPGIGPVTAQKIIDARAEKPFATVDELVTRKIVTAATLAKLRSLATAG
jgi:competence protein ComEA